MFDLYDNDFEKAFDEAVDAIEKKEHRLIWADVLKHTIAHRCVLSALDAPQPLAYRSTDIFDLIDEQPTVEPNTAIETVNWYHQNADGEMVLGANSNQQAWFKADDVFKALKAEPKHGRWLPSDKGDCVYTCSECGFVRDAYILDEKAYCPRCGAKMDEVDDG